MRYILRKIMMYTEELIVDAESKEDAEKNFEEKADEFQRIYDDYCHDYEIVEATEDW